MNIWELATKIRQEARSKRKIRINLTRSVKMYNWIQEPKGKDVPKNKTGRVYKIIKK